MIGGRVVGKEDRELNGEIGSNKDKTYVYAVCPHCKTTNLFGRHSYESGDGFYQYSKRCESCGFKNILRVYLDI